MELSFDWKCFQSLFYVKRRLSLTESNPTDPIYLVVDERVIVAAFAEGEDLSDWVGATSDEVVAEFSHREVILYNRDQVDQWMGSAVGLPHFYDQIQYFRSEAKSQAVTRNRFRGIDFGTQKHFLLHAIQSWWQKVLPSTYGVYIQTQGLTNSAALFLVVQRGRVSSFHTPDLSAMIPDRRKHSADIVKYLAGKYLIPVQGLFISAAEWTEWSESGNPWPKIFKALRADRTKLVPFQWGLTAIIGLRSYFGI